MGTYTMPEDLDFGCSEMILEKILQLSEVHLHSLRIIEVVIPELAIKFQDSEAVHIEGVILLEASDICNGDWLDFLHFHVRLRDIV